MDNFKRKTSETFSTKKLHEESSLLPRDGSVPNLYSILTKRGHCRSYWYIPGIQSSFGLLKSDWIVTQSGSRFRLILINSGREIGFYVEMDVSSLGYTDKLSVSVTIDLYTTNEIQRVDKNSFKFTEDYNFAKRDWGYSNILNADRKAKRPMIFEIAITENYSFEDSKELTGYVGLINEGTTCYINSLLQTLFCLSYFRKAVYSMPAVPEEDTIAFALQQVFYNLQCSTSPVSTRDLLYSFGWSLEQWHIQHDVQEFNCKLGDTLERKMMGTKAEGTYAQLFQGTMKNIIQCVNVDFASETVENFTELQLTVKNFGDIYQSLSNFFEEEKLEGDNQYNTEQFGKQDARKKCVLMKLPPVLQIQLKRFEYDRNNGNLAKVNDCFDFHEHLDLRNFTESNEDCDYSLFSVLVHSGRLNAGHYFAYISPKLNDKWYKFNDSLVSPSTVKQAVENSRGGKDIEFTVTDTMKLSRETSTSECSAYMLVYIKTSQKDRLLREVDSSDIPYELHEKIERAESQRVRIERIQALEDLYCDITLLTFEMLECWNGPGIVPSMSSLYGMAKFSPYNYYSYRILKTSTVQDLKNQLKKHCHGDCRVWSFTPSFHNWELELAAYDFPVESLSICDERVFYVETFSKMPIFRQIGDRWCYIESIEQSTDGSPHSKEVDFLGETNTSVVVFFKIFDGEETRLVDYKAVLQTSLAEIRTHFCENIFHTPDMINKIIIHHEKSKSERAYRQLLPSIQTYHPDENKKIVTEINIFNSIQVKNGDVFVGEISEGKDLAKDYLMNFASQVEVRCRLYDKMAKSAHISYSQNLLHVNNLPNDFTLSFSLNRSVSDFVNALAERFEVNSEQIQLFTQKRSARNPVVLERATYYFIEVLRSENIILFDIFSFPIAELQSSDVVYLQVLNHNYEFVSQHIKSVRKESTLRDLEDVFSEAKAECQNLVKKNDELYEIGYVILTHPEKIILKELDLNTRVNEIAGKNNLTLCMKAWGRREKEEFKTEGAFRLGVIQFFNTDTGTSYMNPTYKMFSKELTCREVSQQLKEGVTSKVEVKIVDVISYIENNYEFKVIKRLEENDDNYFEKYGRKKHIAIEHSPGLNMHSLYIN